MKKILHINAHQPYPFSEGKLNAALSEKAKAHFQANGYEVRSVSMTEPYDIDEEIANHQWADAIFLQTPVNWMGVPWSFKKYMDEVYSYGMDGRLCNGDGRTRKDPSIQYGEGGTLKGKRYMVSLTFNAPKEAFDAPGQYLFQGRGVDDLFFPTHMNFRFFGMEPMETFVCYDVMKNPDVENDFQRFKAHLANHFPQAA